MERGVAPQIRFLCPPEICVLDVRYATPIRACFVKGRVLARGDGRRRLGGEIFIHGKAVSIGCLAIGDDAIEELFTLVADTGVANTRVIIAPGERLDVPANGPWTAELYRTDEVVFGGTLVPPTVVTFGTRSRTTTKSNNRPVGVRPCSR